MIQNPSYVELQKSENQGRRCTWEKLSVIKANCAIEQALDECVALLNHMRRLKKSADRATASSSSSHTVKFNASKRIPSWNVIARENSTGSLEDVLMASLHPHGSDSESEAVDLSSLMRRTASADMVVDDSRMNRGVLGQSLCYGGSLSDTECDRRDFSTGVLTNSSTIVVAEGDLLQTEQIDNGIVLNVVKRSVLTPSSRSHESDLVDEMDDSSVFENDGDGDSSGVPVSRSGDRLAMDG